MSDLTDLRIFLASLLRPIINEAVKESLQTEKPLQQVQPEKDKWFSLSELCEYLPGKPTKPTKPTVYSWVSRRIIPCKKMGKRLAFRQSEINEWLQSHGRKTSAELAEVAKKHFKRKKVMP